MGGHVVFENGVRGEVWPELLAAGGDAPHTRVRLADGRQVLVPSVLLSQRADGAYVVPLRSDDLPPVHESAPAAEGLLGVRPSAVAVGEAVVIPVIEEAALVGKRRVETGRVRVTKSVAEREQVVDEPLSRTTAAVERVPVGRLVDAMPEARQEGDTLVIPVVEEVLVVEKRLMLVEEVRVTQRQSEYRAPQKVVLRREEVTVERLEPVSEPDGS